jgi:hypothetical protein
MLMAEQLWRKQLKFDPVPALLSSANEAIVYFTRRDLLNESAGSLEQVWELPEVRKLLRKQLPDGSWPPAGKKPEVYPPYHYYLVETFRHFWTLVERYCFNKKHPAAASAAEFIFSCQAADGDIRGMIGNQYATYYTGAMLKLLINAGYENDPRVEKGMQWLLNMRQDDGGWIVPLPVKPVDRETMIRLTSEYAEPVEPDRSMAFSHNWTNMVLQAFAAHPGYRRSPEAAAAGNLLKSRFFQPDVYTSYQDPGYWVRFVHWWPNLLMALDSLSMMGFSKDDPDIIRGLDWFVANQQGDGLWNTSYKKGDRSRGTPKEIEERLWVSLAVCRMLKRFLL